MTMGGEKEITLAFDTCLDKMYVTLLSGSTVLGSEIVENHDEKYHSAFLISTIKKVLKENNLKPQDVDLIATNIGPGSFTGIRACTTVARVMAQQLNCRAVGVSSLEILSEIEPDTTMVALDARKDKAYLYMDNEIKGAVLLDEVKSLCKNKKLITDNKLKSLLGGTSYQETSAPLGEMLAKLAIQKAKEDECNWRTLKPLYIQPPPMG